MPVLDYTVTRPSVPDPGALSAVDVSEFNNGVTVFVVSLNAYFRYNNSSSAPADNVTVISANGGGRWLVTRTTFSTTNVLLGRSSAGAGVGEERRGRSLPLCNHR
jgi:hypothetical protein